MMTLMMIFRFRRRLFYNQAHVIVGFFMSDNNHEISRFNHGTHIVLFALNIIKQRQRLHLPKSLLRRLQGCRL